MMKQYFSRKILQQYVCLQTQTVWPVWSSHMANGSDILLSFPFCSKNICLFLSNCVFQSCQFSRTDVLLAELSLVCKAPKNWAGGQKALCTFKLSYIVEFILYKYYFVGLISYFSAFPQFVLSSLILWQSRGFSKWLQQLGNGTFLYIFLQLMLSFSPVVALRILLAPFKDPLGLDFRVVYLLS